MKAAFIHLAFYLSIFSASGQDSLREVLELFNSETIPYISVQELRMHQLKDEVVILDAREAEEYKVSHIPNAQLIGYNDFSSEETLKILDDKDARIVVYCTLGVRSEHIGEKLKKLGFNQVENLYGGIIEWKNKNFPVMDIEGNETQKVHTNSRFWGRWLTNGEKVY